MLSSSESYVLWTTGRAALLSFTFLPTQFYLKIAKKKQMTA